MKQKKGPFTDPRMLALRAGDRVQGVVVGYRPRTGAFVNCEVGHDLLVHAADCSRIAVTSMPKRGDTVSGRVAPFFPQKRRVGLIPDFPHRDEPFPVGEELAVTIADVTESDNSSTPWVFANMDGSVDGVIVNVSELPELVPGVQVRVRIADVDWVSNPEKPLVKLKAVGSPVSDVAATTAPSASDPSAAPGPTSSPSPAPILVIDASNVAKGYKATARLSELDEVGELLRNATRGARTIFVFDRSYVSAIDGRSAFELAARQARGEVLIALEGLPADPLILAVARHHGAVIVTNDSFEDDPKGRTGLPLLRFVVDAVDGFVPGVVETFDADGQRFCRPFTDLVRSWS